MVTDDQIKEVIRRARKYACRKGFDYLSEDFAQEAAIECFLNDGDVFYKTLFVDFLRVTIGRIGERYFKAKAILSSVPFHELDFDWKSDDDRMSSLTIDFNHPIFLSSSGWSQEIDIVQTYLEDNHQLLSATDKRIIKWILRGKQQQWIAKRIGCSPEWISTRRNDIARRIKQSLQRKDGFDEKNNVIDARKLKAEIQWARKNYTKICKRMADKEIVQLLWIEKDPAKIKFKYKLTTPEFRRRKNLLLRRIREEMAKEAIP